MLSCSPTYLRRPPTRTNGHGHSLLQRFYPGMGQCLRTQSAWLQLLCLRPGLAQAPLSTVNPNGYVSHFNCASSKRPVESHPESRSRCWKASNAALGHAAGLKRPSRRSNTPRRRLRVSGEQRHKGRGCRDARPLLASQVPPSLCSTSAEHLVRLKEERRRNGDPEGPGGFQGNDQRKGHRLFYRQFGGISALQNLIHIGRGTAV